ncbi:MAG: MoxR family ATPase [Phycisphaerales bacterium]
MVHDADASLPAELESRPMTTPTTPPLEAIAQLRDRVRSVFLGHPQTVDQLLVCLLARGHALIEDVPGVGKTVLATALARSLDCTFSRVQLTPDMLPADVLGVSVYDRETGRFEFKRGPIFANVVLADEVNRTTPRTQSALLESMSEGKVTVEGRQVTIDPPFIVVATQNPYEFEGTYPLPENQLDRFLMRITLGYPSAEDEARVLELRPGDVALPALEPAMHASDVLELQRATDAVRLDRALIDYIVEICRASREHPDLRLGMSTRAALALAHASRANALLDGRDYVIPEDITTHALDVGAHRVLPAHHAGSNASGLLDADAGRDILEDVMRSVPAPV